MRLVFLCGSLEPGRDGVGDYVRLLSAELNRQGHLIGVVAINDRHITEVIKDSILPDGQVSVLRLPADLMDKERFRLLTMFVDDFNPDWLSLQFVPFSFHSKGLVYGLARQLALAAKGRPWHIMFHELWVGMARQSSKKEQVWGIVQRLLIRNLMRKLRPAAIHTHTALYKKQLENLAERVELLPLFSNIPVCCPEKIIEKLGRDIQIADTVSIMVFGGIHGGAPIQQLAEEAEKYASQHQLRIELLILGRNGGEQERWVKEWTGAHLSSRQLGELPAEKVSEILTQVSLGVFTTPIALVEKSGSVAAMREHGIHLLCVSRNWDPRKISIGNNPFGILNYKVGALATFFKSKPDFSYMPSKSAVAQQFVSNLKHNK